VQIDLIIILTAILFSVFFSGMEIAFVSTNKIFLEIEKKRKSVLSNILKKITKKPSKFIITMLVGNSIALVIYALFSGKLILSYLYPEIDQSLSVEFKYIFFQTLISSIFIIFTAEFLPKVLFQIYSNKIFKYLSLPAYFFFLMFSPISYLLDRISKRTLNKYIKTKEYEMGMVFSKDELGDYINEELANDLDNQEKKTEIQIFKNALEFSSVKAREVMVPRAEIVSVDRYTNTSIINQKFITNGLSKVLIHRENIDHILGYVSLFDMFSKQKNIKSIIRNVEFIPETMLINDIMKILTQKRIGIAVVIDEYGGTSGIITIEDVIEELFGEIEDEHDVTELTELEFDTKNFLFSARLEVDYLNDKYKLEIPESDEYETLGGYIVHNTQGIPKKGEIVKLKSLEFEIKDVTETKIETLSLMIRN
tara:strand:- start:6403 stop:7671 length:1269 start_codon:yes stop_codon:yes gene_type:complete